MLTKLTAIPRRVLSLDQKNGLAVYFEVIYIGWATVRTKHTTLSRYRIAFSSLLMAASAMTNVAVGQLQVPTQELPATTTNDGNRSSLRSYNMPPEMVGAVAASLRIKFANNPAVNVTTEPGSDRLMVFGPSAVHAEIQSVVESVNQRAGVNIAATSADPIAPPETQRIYQMRNVDWKNFESELQKFGGRQLSVQKTAQGDIADYRMSTRGSQQNDIRVDRKNNSVLLQGSSKNVSAWQRVIAAIDNSYERGSQPATIASLDNAKPENVERALNLVKMVAFQTDADEEELGVVPTDDEESVTALGTPDGLSEESGLFGDVQIEFVNELGVIIVKGKKSDVQRVLKVIDDIKKQSIETQPDVKVVPLQHVDSVALSNILRQLYDANFSQRQGAVSITGLDQPNAILLVGRADAMTAVLELIEQLDKPLDPTSQLKVFKLLHMSSTDAQTIVRDFFIDRRATANQNQNQATGLGARVSVIADYRTNSLIVQASPRDMLEVSKLITEIDVEATEAESDIQVFPLRSALSDDLAPILQNAINGQVEGGTGEVTPPSTNLSISTADGRINSGILAGVVVTSNPSINALVVRAPRKSMDLVAALIEKLDQPPNLEAQIKVFPIKHNDATALAQIIQQLFGLAVTAGAATTGIGAGFNQNNANQGTGNDPLVPLRVSIDTRSNSIIVSGSKGDLDVVEVLIWRLDEEGVQTRKTEVVWLRNSSATDVATAIQDFLTTQRTTIQQTLLQGQQISISEQIDREVIVVAEPTTNSLIISATPRYYEQIMAVIQRLDRRPPMIMVQILLAEVNLSDTFEAGAELGLQDSLLFDRNSATGGTLSSPGFNVGTPLTSATTAGQTQQVAGQGLSSFAMGRSNSALGYGGLVLSAASESVNILVRALQDANRLQILSRPQVMTLDTIEAFVQVGQQVPRVTSVQGGNQLSAPVIQTTDTPVGLIMRIQPRTNQDGLIIMDVQIERSALDNSSQGIPVGFSASGDAIFSPIINITRAQTRVSAYDGQTVVFAGLIQKTRTSRSRRIPYLADIPIAGNLFKFESESESRSELLVVMTPRIVYSEQDVEMINDIESSRMSWCLADVVNINGVTQLSPGNGLWGPACSPVIYPDVTPTVDLLDRSTANYEVSGTPIQIQGYDPGAPSMQPAQPMFDPDQVTPSIEATVPDVLNPVVVPQATRTIGPRPELQQPMPIQAAQSFEVNQAAAYAPAVR